METEIIQLRYVIECEKHEVQINKYAMFKCHEEELHMTKEQV